RGAVAAARALRVGGARDAGPAHDAHGGALQRRPAQRRARPRAGGSDHAHLRRADRPCRPGAHGHHRAPPAPGRRQRRGALDDGRRLPGEGARAPRARRPRDLRPRAGEPGPARHACRRPPPPLARRRRRGVVRRGRLRDRRAVPRGRAGLPRGGGLGRAAPRLSRDARGRALHRGAGPRLPGGERHAPGRVLDRAPRHRPGRGAEPGALHARGRRPLLRGRGEDARGRGRLRGRAALPGDAHARRRQRRAGPPARDDGRERAVGLLPAPAELSRLERHIAALGSPPVSTLVGLPLRRDGKAASFGLDLGPHVARVAGKERPGTYLVGLRRLDSSSERSWMRVQVTDLSLTTLEEPDAVRFAVTSLAKGLPIAGASIRVEGTRENEWATLAEGTTGADGSFRWPAPGWDPAHPIYRQVRRITVASDGDVLVLDPLHAPDGYADNRWSATRETWLQWAFEPLAAR